MSQVLIIGVIGLVGGYLLRMLINMLQVSVIVVLMCCLLMDIVGVYNFYDLQFIDVLVQVIDLVDIVFCCLGMIWCEVGSKVVFIYVDYMLVVDIVLIGC